MQKTDLTKEYKSYYSAKAEPALLELDEVIYLSVTGRGDPSSEAFSEKVGALYATAYAVKFLCKAEGNDFVVAKLEGLWWFDTEKYKDISMTDAPLRIPREEWNYRLLMRLPTFVNEGHVQRARLSVTGKGISLAAGISLYSLTEGKVVQVLHTGPFDKEPETLARMQQFMHEKSLAANGLHHEIYLSDFRKTAPDKLRTILREPVKEIPGM